MHRPGPRRERLLQRGEGGLRRGPPTPNGSRTSEPPASEKSVGMSEEGGGFACAIQPHCEVRPEFGLSIYEIYDMKACRITTLFSGRGGGRKEKDRDTIKGRAGRVCFCCPAACIATHCLHTAAQRMGGNPFLLSSRTHKTAAQGEGERLAFAVQPHTNAAQSRA